MIMRNLAIVTAILFSTTFISCGSSSNGTQGNSDVSATTCGTIGNGKYINPISDSDGAVVFLSSVSETNLVIVEDSFGAPILVRLLGIQAEPRSRFALAKRAIQDFAGRGMLYIESGCKDTSGAFVGSLYNRKGENLSELLARTGLANAATSDICGGNRISQCLSSIASSNPINAGELSRFLWKPIADSDSNLAIHTGPFGTTVVVRGETGENQGAGNGYGSLARFNRPGCAYGGARIEVLNSDGIPYTVGGKTSFSVPNPCGRYCIEGSNGQVVACTKN